MPRSPPSTGSVEQPHRAAAEHLLEAIGAAVNRPGGLKVGLAALLLVSAVGFGFASAAERSKERKTGGAFGAPEGSAAREEAEQSTASSIPATTLDVPPSTAVPLQTAAPTTAPEGPPAREAAERARHGPATTESTPTTAATTTRSTGGTAASTGSSGPATTRAAPAPAVGETLFGVRTESAGTTAAVVVLLSLMAALVLAVPNRRVLLGVAAIALLLAVLDSREAVHQHDESRAGLAAAAVVLASAHLGAAALSVISSRLSDPRPGVGAPDPTAS